MSLSFNSKIKDTVEALLRKQVGLRRFICDLLESQTEAFIVDRLGGCQETHHREAGLPSPDTQRELT